MKFLTSILPNITLSPWGSLPWISLLWKPLTLSLAAFLLFSLAFPPAYSNEQGLDSHGVSKITIVRGMGNYSPLEVVQGEQLTGLHIEMINVVAKKLNIQVEFISLPWTRAVHEFSEGKYDAISYFGYTEERAKFAYFHTNNILSNTHWVFLSLKERQDEFHFEKDLTGLENLIIGVQNGYSHGSFFDSKKHINRDVVMNEFDLEFMLKKRRHDLVMMSFQEYRGFKKRGDFEGIVALSPMIDMDPQYLAFSKIKSDINLKYIAEKFSNQFKIFKESEEYNQLLEKYNFSHFK